MSGDEGTIILTTYIYWGVIHSQTDDIFVVMDVNDFDRGKQIKCKLRNFSHYIEKSLLYRLKHQAKPYVFPEDDEEGIYKTHRFSLKCKTSEFKYKPLLKVICNQDWGISPSIFHRVYFINSNKKTIFHVYDDRGCDLLATSTDTIRYIYMVLIMKGFWTMTNRLLTRCLIETR